jgi:hypothetical protein
MSQVFEAQGNEGCTMPKHKSRSIQKSTLREKAEKVPVDLSTLPPWGSIKKALSGAEFQVIEP